MGPGLINKNGKSDIQEIDESVTTNNKNKNNNDDDDNDMNNEQMVLSSKQPSLNLTNWQFGGQSFSGSETSDDEKDFGAMNEKYKTWSHQFMANKQRNERMEVIKKKTLRNLKKSKKNIVRLQQEVNNNQSKEKITYGPPSDIANATDSNSKRLRRGNDLYKKWKKNKI